MLVGLASRRRKNESQKPFVYRNRHENKGGNEDNACGGGGEGS